MIHIILCILLAPIAAIIIHEAGHYVPAWRYGLNPRLRLIWHDVPFRYPSFGVRNDDPASDYQSRVKASQSDAFRALAADGDIWIQAGIDGMRLDAVKCIYADGYDNENPTFLKQFYERMNNSFHASGAGLDPTGDFYMVGEMMDEANNVAPYYAGLPALFEFSFWYRLDWALQHETGMYFVHDISGYRTQYAAVRSDYIAATKLSNHDENRAASDLGRSAEKERLAAAVLLTASGAPYIYQGEELGYWGTKDNGDEYVRTPILWDKAGTQLASGDLNGKIDQSMLTPAISVEAEQADAASLLNTYRTFARLRNTYPALAVGTMTPHPVYNDSNADYPSIAAWYREAAGQRMLVIHNFGKDAQLLTLTDPIVKAVGVAGDVKLKTGDASSQVLMGAYSSVIFEL